MKKSKDKLSAALHAPVRTDRDLDRIWRALMGPLGFRTRRLWILLLDADDRPVPQVTQIDDIPYEIDARLCEPVMHMCLHLLESIVPGGSVAILFSRPGQNSMSQGDRELARALHTAASDTDVALRPTHFANDVVLSVFALDDLLPSSTGAG
jgi:hypothetical protein